MLFTLRLVAIAAIILATNLNLFTQQDTSGWVQTGNVWLNKHEIGTILQAGLSTTGDSIWTFSDDNGYYFRIWELKSGMMVYEKQFGPKYIISRDFQTYYYDEPANFKLYDLKTDSLILEKDLERGRIEYSHDCYYDINRSLLFVACSYIDPGQGHIPAHTVNEMFVSKVQNSTIVSTINMTQYFIAKGFMLNRDRTWIASIKFTPNFYDIEKNKYYEIGSRPSHTSIVRFTSNPYHLAALESDNYMCIWQIQNRGLISRSQLKLGNIGTYSFSEQDKFIAAVSNNRFYLLDLFTGNAIDSSEYYPYQGMRLLQDKSPHGFVFVTNEDKFGLVNFDTLSKMAVSVYTTSIGGTHSVLPAPNPAENTVSLRFADEQNVRNVRVYDYSGIEVMQFTLPQSPVYEVQLPLQALSTGMYHVTVTTDSGILRTKFIKY
jgi:hypothetical protein